MPGQNIVWLCVCTRKRQAKRQVKKKNNIVFIYNYESNSHGKILKTRTFLQSLTFCQKEEIDHMLGNRKGARHHPVSTE